MTDRRTFLKQAGLLAASLPLGVPALAAEPTPSFSVKQGEKWPQLRSLFELDYSLAHFSNFLITSHPRPVREAIAQFRAELDRNPAAAVDYESEAIWKHEDNARNWAANYLGVKPAQIALTGSTTEGLSLIYTGIHIRPDQELLTTEHEHSSAYAAMRFRKQRENTLMREIRLYDDPQTLSVDQVVQKLKSELRPNTRVLALTWVHSGSGVKLPIGEIGKMVREHNQGRAEADRLLLCVDGVHGFGIENVNFADLNCDYFIAGTHKWLFGPRGTGIICSATAGMDNMTPTVGSFSRPDDSFASVMSPGGYHSFEHRWALGKAFELHLLLGKADVQARIHQLNSYLKQRLQSLKGVQLVTPISPAFSAGFTFFKTPHVDEDAIAAYLTRNGVIVDAVNRDVGPVVRMAPGLLNTEADIDRAINLLAKQL
ncbi:aminotransferase class V-fold PLP-dependent enzyme [Pseudomonas sp. GV071]|uniref:pyoverdine-tailoring periplasmic protein PvdN n=1 Tax=Pseudomonas sp. GV071 TaxID=2135754 RepID=UPI000D3AA5E6|nr:aminotransferase class V-fold PLP-dependent enzyme [Pseudomonas sp. GV071]PTQ68430.1 selenocysteine lyase/cysteine desulfurase [Pseudomonas sp. GV071]